VTPYLFDARPDFDTIPSARDCPHALASRLKHILGLGSLAMRFVAAAWMADRQTRERRQRVRLRISLVQHRAALKNQVHAILLQASTATVTGSENPRNHRRSACGSFATGRAFKDRPVESSAVM
jgi:hypothetical protein